MTITAIRMPKWGLSMAQGTLTSWHVSPGAVIAKGDAIAEVETDKISNAIESTAAGVLRRIVIGAGEVARVGSVIGILADESISEDDINLYIEASREEFSGTSEGVDDPSPIRLATVVVGEHAIRVGSAGPESDEPIVLIHGFAGDLDNWQFVVPLLCQSRAVIALDLPGHGGSSRAVGDGSIDFLANIVSGCLAKLDVDHYHLVGHSLGGAVAAVLAQRNRARVASLTMICPIGVPGAAIAAEFIRGITTANRARDLRHWLEMLVDDPASISRSMVDGMLKYKRLDGVASALELIGERLIAGIDLTNIQAKLYRSAPALIVSSRSDKIVGTPIAEQLPPEMSLTLLSGVGHMPHLEAPSDLASLILRQVDIAK